MPSSVSAEPGPRSHEEHLTPAEHYAALLSERPEGAAVVVDDALAGAYDLEELEADLHDAFGGLDVPYHVVASPFPEAAPMWGGDMLPALADRVGADGLYVLLQPHGVPSARVVGVSLPVDAATDVVLYDRDLDHAAPIDQVADVFTRSLADPEVEARADRLRDEYDPEHEDREGYEGHGEPSAWDEFLQDLDPATHVGPSNLGFLVSTTTGALLTLALCHVWWARRRGRDMVAAGAVAVVFGLALPAVGVTGALYYVNSVPPGESEVPDSMERIRSEPPYVPSTVRVERVLDGLGDGSLYVDPLSPLSREGLAEAAERVERAPVPVYAAVLPMTGTDESEAIPERFAHAMHHLLDEDGVYAVITDDYEGGAETTTLAFGVGLDSYDLVRDTEVENTTTPAQELDLLLEAIGEAPQDPHASEPRPYDTSGPTPEPRAARFWEDFWAGVLFLGPLVGLILLGAVLGLVALAARLRVARRRQPSSRALRRTAEAEYTRLTSLLSSKRANRLPDELMPSVEAALMVMDADPDDLDLAGVTVVSHRAHAALDDPDSAGTSPCMINPLHGPATGFKRSGLAGLRGIFPVCRACADLDDNRRGARVLHVRDPRGKPRPHLSMDERAWVRYRFGAKSPARMAEKLLEEIDAR